MPNGMTKVKLFTCQMPASQEILQYKRLKQIDCNQNHPLNRLLKIKYHIFIMICWTLIKSIWSAPLLALFQVTCWEALVR